MKEAVKLHMLGELDPFFLHPPKLWSFKEETMKHVSKMIEIIYQNSEGLTADLTSNDYKNYLYSAFKRLYGIEYDITENCLFI